MFTTELRYVLIRYMLNELGDEAANVGLVAVTDDPPNVIARALEDPSIKSRGDARIKSDIVARFMSYATTCIASAQADAANTKAPLSSLVFDCLREISGGVVRVGSERSVLTNETSSETELLYRQLVLPARYMKHHEQMRTRDPLGGLRKDAAAALVRAFREGYGQRLPKGKVSRSYQVRGANHKSVFDLVVYDGGPKKRREHLFQHVLVLPDAEETYTQAAGLCCRWGDVLAANHADRELTAVFYHRPGTRAGSAVTTDALKLLRHEKISVADIHDVPTSAQRYSAQQRLPLASRR